MTGSLANIFWEAPLEFILEKLSGDALLTNVLGKSVRELSWNALLRNSVGKPSRGSLSGKVFRATLSGNPLEKLSRRNSLGNSLENKLRTYRGKPLGKTTTMIPEIK